MTSSRSCDDASNRFSSHSQLFLVRDIPFMQKPGES